MDSITATASGEVATCRICRSEDEPLFHPCRCSGSIRNVHQECLVEWLAHSQKKHCELCKTPFRFTKLYDAEMPNVLPWDVFIQRAVVHAVNGVLRSLRALLVAAIWLVILPWVVRWSWRWMFYFADAGWARDIYFARLQQHSGLQGERTTTNLSDTWDTRRVTAQLQDAVANDNATTSQHLYDYAFSFLVSIGIETFANTTHFDTPHAWKKADASIFSSLSYISALTPYPAINRIVLDIFEGQLITCLVILSFILIFLIREWVVQQQPVVNLDLLARQRELAENERRQRQRLELLEQARRTLEELEQASAEIGVVLEDAMAEDDLSSSAELRRPRMPNRDASSRAMKVQRLIEEADAILGPPDGSEGARVDGSGPAALKLRTLSNEARNASIFADLPITNAGPDAKLNITRSFKGSMTVVPPPISPPQPLISNEELEQRLSAITTSDDQPSADFATLSDTTVVVEPIHNAQLQTQEPEEQAQSDVTPSAPEDLDVTEDIPTSRPEDLLKKSACESFADWFWGDVEASTPELVPVVDDEQRLDANDVNQAPFAPIQQHQHDIRDPEVVAAAQQAGLDAEQAEEVEDLEGILELIGLQGPIAGLLQTSLFCLLLVVCTVAGAVMLPYLWGKLVLSFVGSPLYFMVTLPLQIASTTADFVVDLVLFLGGWALTLASVGTEVALQALHNIWPRLYTMHAYAVKVSDFAMAEANASGDRLRAMFASNDTIDPLGINAGLLGASVHSHLALKNIEVEVLTIWSFASAFLRHILEIVLQGKMDHAWTGMIAVGHSIQDVLSLSRDVFELILDFFSGGSPFVKLPAQAFSDIKFDPELVYWSSTDRTLAVCAGYAALAFIATVYVAADISITRSSHKTEKMIRNSLRQAGGVFKVILIISIEMLVFPFYCGLLLDLAFLPLFPGASTASRLSFASSTPYIFCFVHWFVGTCYMFHFALFVGMCRRILRKGVLWFIRDPDDPTFHPVRDVLERNVTTQLRKIAFSALVYGALVILCLGGVIWGIGKVFNGIFPIYFTVTEPTVEFPLDLLLYNFVTPLVIGFFKPSDIIHAMYAWWLRKCARLLRLSHFLFDDRRTDEEGHIANKPWSNIARFLESAQQIDAVIELPDKDELPAADFQKDGQYVLTPCNDQYRPPKQGEAFLQITDEDVFIANKDGSKNDSFAKVYIPPLFRSRVTLFMVCLWIFSAFSGLCATLLPLILGRSLLGLVLPHVRLSDIYAYSLGAYTLGAGVLLAQSGLGYAHAAHARLRTAGLTGVLSTTFKFLGRAAKVVYTYGFGFVVLPLTLGMIIEAHLMVPLHVLFILGNTGRLDILHDNFSTIIATSDDASSVATQPVSMLLNHTVHIVQDMALGVLMMRIIWRAYFVGPGSRAVEVQRRINRHGRLNPDAYLTTRYLVLPTLALGLLTLALPPAIAAFIQACAHVADYGLTEYASILYYRFSYPTLSVSVFLTLCLRALAKATARWRARIRDEVYLVGERLHNFGETRPPAGSRSVMRRSVAAGIDT